MCSSLSFGTGFMGSEPPSVPEEHSLRRPEGAGEGPPATSPQKGKCSWQVEAGKGRGWGWGRTGVSPPPHAQLADIIIVFPADVIILLAGTWAHPESLGTTIWIWRQAPRKHFCLPAFLHFYLSTFLPFCLSASLRRHLSQPQPPHPPGARSRGIAGIASMRPSLGQW